MKPPDEIAKLQRQLDERTAQLESLGREFDAFGYSVSHDLRAPLRSINGFARILQEDFAGDLPGPAREHLERITRAAGQMGSQVDGLLDFSRVGRAKFNPERIDMDSLVDKALAQSQAAAGREVQWERSPLPAATGDAALLGRVWLELLGNALKFTRGSSPARIAIGCEAAAGSDTYYVRDNGVGFDPRFAERLFSMFQRLHRADQFEGVGAGLAIARRCVERHGGTVAAEAAPGEGATFRFTLGP